MLDSCPKMAYCDSFAKNHEGNHAVVVTVFSIDKIKTLSSTHWITVRASYGSAEAMIIPHDNDLQTKRERIYADDIEVYNSSTEKKIKREKGTGVTMKKKLQQYNLIFMITWNI